MSDLLQHSRPFLSSSGAKRIATMKTALRHEAEALHERSDNELDALLAEAVARVRAEDARGVTSAKGNVLAILVAIARRSLEGEPLAYVGQVETALHLINGSIVEQPNGEGKTLACALAAAFFCLVSDHVNVATYNSYLAERDAVWMAPFFLRLGLEVGVFLADGRVAFILPKTWSWPAGGPDLLAEWKLMTATLANVATVIPPDIGKQRAAIYRFLDGVETGASLRNLIEYLVDQGVRSSLEDLLRSLPGKSENSEAPDTDETPTQGELDQSAEGTKDLPELTEKLRSWLQRNTGRWMSPHELETLPRYMSSPLEAVHRYAGEVYQHGLLSESNLAPSSAVASSNLEAFERFLASLPLHLVSNLKSHRVPNASPAVPELQPEMNPGLKELKVVAEEPLEASNSPKDDEELLPMLSAPEEAAQLEVVATEPPSPQMPTEEDMARRENEVRQALRFELGSFWMSGFLGPRTNKERLADWSSQANSMPGAVLERALKAILSSGYGLKPNPLESRRGARSQILIVRERIEPRPEFAFRFTQVLYGTLSDFIFAELHADRALSAGYLALPPLRTLLVDECDEVLVTNARRSVQIIQDTGETGAGRYSGSMRDLVTAVNELQESVHYDPHKFYVTPAGRAVLQDRLHVADLLSAESSGLLAFVENVLKGLRIYRLREDYIIQDNQVYPLDRASGRPMFSQQMSPGIRQAVEWKHGLFSYGFNNPRESISLRETTVYTYLSTYEHVAGLSGSARFCALDFANLYGLPTVVVPPRLPSRREILHDKIYRMRAEKFHAVAREVVEQGKTRRPLLVDCATLEEATILWRVLVASSVEKYHAALVAGYEYENRKIPPEYVHFGPPSPPALEEVATEFETLRELHLTPELLTAEHLEDEARIIAQAGAVGALTITAKLAGRGTDIVVGEEADELGGLMVIGFERSESRNVDEQVQGRVARQGRRGASIFFVSFLDELMLNFEAGQRMMRIMTTFGLDHGQNLEHTWLNRSVMTAQKRVAEREAARRQALVQREQLAGRHRHALLGFRRQLLLCEDAEAVCRTLQRMIHNQLVRAANEYLRGPDRKWNRNGFVAQLAPLGLLSRQGLASRIEGRAEDFILSLGHTFEEPILRLRRSLGDTPFVAATRTHILEAIDQQWLVYLQECEQAERQAQGSSGWFASAEGVGEQTENEWSRIYWETVRRTEVATLAAVFAHEQKQTAENRLQPAAASADAETSPPATVVPTQKLAWPRFQHRNLEVVSLGMVLEVLRSAAGAISPRLLLSLGAYLVGIFWVGAWGLGGLAEKLAPHPELESVLISLLGPALYTGGTLVLGLAPLLLRHGPRIFWADSLNSPSIWFRAVGALFSAGALLWVAGPLGPQVPGWSSWMWMVSPALVTLLLSQLAFSSSTLFPTIILSVFYTGSATLLWLAARGIDAWTPWGGWASRFLILSYVCFAVWTAVFNIHNGLRPTCRYSFAQLHLAATTMLVLAVAWQRDPWQFGPALITGAVLGYAYVRQREIQVRFVVEDFSAYEPTTRESCLPVPNLLLVVAAVLITFVVGVVAVITAEKVFRWRGSVFAVLHPWDILWPIAALGTTTAVLSIKDQLREYARMSIRSLLSNLEKTHQVPRGETKEPIEVELSRKMVEAFTSRAWFMFITLFAPWTIAYAWRVATGHEGTMPLGLAGFPLLLIFNVDLVAFTAERIGRALQRLDSQELWLSGITMAKVETSGEFGLSPLLSRHRELVEELKAAFQRDHIMFLKQIYRYLMNLTAALDLKKGSPLSDVYGWFFAILQTAFFAGLIAVSGSWLLSKISSIDASTVYGLSMTQTLFFGSGLALLGYTIICELRRPSSKAPQTPFEPPPPSGEAQMPVIFELFHHQVSGTSPAALQAAEGAAEKIQKNLTLRREGIRQSLMDLTDDCNRKARGAFQESLFITPPDEYSPFYSLCSEVRHEDDFKQVTLVANKVFREGQCQELKRGWKVMAAYRDRVKTNYLRDLVTGVCKTEGARISPQLAILATYLRDPRIQDLFLLRNYYHHSPQRETDRAIGELFQRWIKKRYPNADSSADWTQTHFGFLGDLQEWLYELRDVLDEPEAWMERLDKNPERLRHFL